ncbi:MAG: hypothetical protein ACEQR8_10675 [Cypionkella sp.]
MLAPFKRLRRMRAARLLLLEFVVVLAGVLAAQLLQDWFANRAERARAGEARTGIVNALHNTAELADIRMRMNLCMLDRIERARDVLAGRGGQDAFLLELRVPEQQILDDPGFEAARPLLAKHFGPRDAMIFSSIQYLQDQMNAAQDTELAAWQRLALLRPDNGPLDPALRAELQLALADAARANRLLAEAGSVVFGHAEELKVPRHARTLELFAQSPKLCAAMVGYPRDRHGEAAKAGRLPDGNPLHPRLQTLLAPAPDGAS